MQSIAIGRLSGTGFSRAALSAMLLLTLVVAGCGNGGGDTAGGAGSSGGASTLAGGVAHGGDGPLVGATVTAYKAGTNGYGAGAVVLATAVTDQQGGFNFSTGTCNTGDAVYYAASGGNAGDGNNPAIGLMAVVGICPLLPTFVSINEVTTVGTVYGLSRFIGTSSPHLVGTSATNVTGLNNAFLNVGNLVDVANGVARATPPAGGTAPQATVNTIANALISCVNADPGQPYCVELFDCAMPNAIFDGSASCSGGTGSTPTDTIGATLNMALNPAQVSVAGIFDSSTFKRKFHPALTTAPKTLALVLSFTPNGPNVFSEHDIVAIDAAGYAWVSNFNGGVNKLTPTGALAGKFDNANTPGANFNHPTGATVDTANNIWFLNALSGITELTSSGALIANYNNTNTPGANFFGNGRIAFDKAGDLWTANGPSVTKLTASGALIANLDNTTTPGANFNGTFSLAIDVAGNVWLTNELGNSVTKLSSSGVLLGYFDNNNTPGANFGFNTNVAIDPVGDLWFINSFSLTKLTSSGALLGNIDNANTPGSDIFATWAGIAIDSAGNVWEGNAGSFGGAHGSVTELSSSGALIGNFDTNANGNFLNGAYTLAIDASGNVWVTNYNLGAGIGNVIEFVGAARPVRTPKVACLKLSPQSAVCLP